MVFTKTQTKQNKTQTKQNKTQTKRCLTKLAPAPESILDRAVSKCVADRCKCRKNGLNCSEMCGCENCGNDKKHEEMFLDCRSEVDGDDF